VENILAEIQTRDRLVGHHHIVGVVEAIVIGLG